VLCVGQVDQGDKIKQGPPKLAAPVKLDMTAICELQLNELLEFSPFS
jgi:hypothetical protein